MKIAVASGKGGTGKTTVSVNLAAVCTGSVQLIDCDVEEPNAHLFLKPQITSVSDVDISVPRIDENKCTFCGKCKEACVFNAITVVRPKDERLKGSHLVFDDLCHGCGVCSYVCPVNAVAFVPNKVGELERGCAGKIDFVHGRLRIGAAMAPPVIKAVKKHIDNSATVIIDSPPGTSCSMVATVQGCDYCVLVTEPTPFGLNDLKLAVDVVKETGIAYGVVINKADIGDCMVQEYCRAEDITVLAEIPFCRETAVEYSKGSMLVDSVEGYREMFENILGGIKGNL